MDQTRLIAELRDERDELAERVRQLQTVLVDDEWIPSAWQLKSADVCLVNLLLARLTVTLDAWETAVQGTSWSKIDKASGCRSALSVRVHLLRRKLPATLVRIENIWGHGYRLDEASRSVLLDMRTAARSANEVMSGAAHAR